MKTNILSLTFRKVDCPASASVLVGELRVDGEHVGDKYALNVHALAQALLREGEHFIFTCGCGVPECAGIHEGFKSQIAEDKVVLVGSLPKGGSMAFTFSKAQARNAADGLDVEQLDVSGNGISLLLAKPLHLTGGKLPDEAALTVTARDANLVSLTPFLAMANLTATAGRWTGEAELALVKGEPTITTVKTHAFAGLTLERDGKVLLKEVDAQLPLRSEGGAIFIAPFSLSSTAGQIAAGDAVIRPGKDGAWSVTANAQVGIARAAFFPTITPTRPSAPTATRASCSIPRTSTASRNRACALTAVL